MRYEKEQLEQMLDEITEFQSFQAVGLFLTKICWLCIIVSNFWSASMSIINKIVFGILFLDYPFTVYLFRELGFNVGIKYTSLLIGVSIFVFIMTGLFNIVDSVVEDIELAIEAKEQEEKQ